MIASFLWYIFWTVVLRMYVMQFLKDIIWMYLLKSVFSMYTSLCPKVGYMLQPNGQKVCFEGRSTTDTRTRACGC